MAVRFEWSPERDVANQRKHGVPFSVAQQAFLDPAHGSTEPRYYCIGRAEGGVLTVRFTYRGDVIRIIGAGFWRKGRRYYEEQNSL